MQNSEAFNVPWTKPWYPIWLPSLSTILLRICISFFRFGQKPTSTATYLKISGHVRGLKNSFQTVTSKFLCFTAWVNLRKFPSFGEESHWTYFLALAELWSSLSTYSRRSFRKSIWIFPSSFESCHGKHEETHPVWMIKNWSHQLNYIKIKKPLTLAPLLSPPDYNRYYLLYLAAAESTIGMVLF